MFKQLAASYISQLEPYMQNFIASVPDEPDFSLMMRYAMGWVDENGHTFDHPTGKRLRPTLLLLANETAGGNWNDALPAAGAIELIHNFSLIHDDIQDNSAFRHHRPTLWRVWGTANAINAGDAMFTLAYSMLHALNDTYTSELVTQIWGILNRTNLELTRGQHLDMRFEHLAEVEIAEYISMISGKSAALIAGSAEIGALLATGDQEIAKKYAEFGLHLGIAFQIRDDILGIWGDAEVTGKSTATDIISHKKSLPVLYGIEHSPELSELYQIETFSEHDVREVLQLLERLNAEEYARNLELEYHQTAMQALRSADVAGKADEILIPFVDSLFSRQY